MTRQSLILVADDDPDILNLICIRLERAGYVTLRASDGKQALRLAREREPDLCILDVVMPERSGYEVLEAMRRDEETRRIPVIILTATASEKGIEGGSRVEADEYLTKPFDARDLQKRVQRLLRQP